MDDSRPWWLWPNLLSLDAPAVAVIWQSFLAAKEGIEVPISAVITLALTVWGIYLADRWLDVRGIDIAATDRHCFAATNRRGVAGLALVVLLAAAGIAIIALPYSYLRMGGILTLFMLGYFAVVHLLVRQASCKGLKEGSVGAVFAIGVAIPLMVQTSQSNEAWIFGVLAFGGVCVLNCILISRWEENAAAAPAQWIVWAASSIAIAAAGSARLPVAFAVLTSLGLLLALALLRSRISTRVLRVLADVALLSPLIVTVWT